MCLMFQNSKAMTQLRSEVDLIRRLDHPNIVRLQQVFETEESLYLVMVRRREVSQSCILSSGRLAGGTWTFPAIPNCNSPALCKGTPFFVLKSLQQLVVKVHLLSISVLNDDGRAHGNFPGSLHRRGHDDPVGEKCEAPVLRGGGKATCTLKLY